MLDIRDPHHLIEIGYFNPGINGVLGTAAHPVVRAERGEIWFTHELAGLFVLWFRDGIWPFRDSEKCPEFHDHCFAHYNPRSSCPSATFDGIGKPAPAAPRYQKRKQ